MAAHFTMTHLYGVKGDSLLFLDQPIGCFHTHGHADVVVTVGYFHAPLGCWRPCWTDSHAHLIINTRLSNLLHQNFGVLLLICIFLLCVL